MRLYFTVPDTLQTQNGTLVRNFLRQCAVSTELARAVKFQGGGFFADGAPVLANRRVYPGQVLSFDLPPEAGGVAPQPDIAVQVVYEDAFAVVLEKPPHLAVHPTLNYPGGTLANGYAAWALQQGRSPVFRPVNRIDKDTSGLVLAARNTYAAPLLAENVQKLYYAIVEGELPLGPGVIDAPIGRRGDSIIGRCVTPEGKPSRTEYTILKVQNGLSLAACVPVTGRTHQIRVHFASIGHPLAGDDLYGGRRDRIGRQALHCAKQTFRVPEYTEVPDGICIRTPVSAGTGRCRRIWPTCFREKCVKELPKFCSGACFIPCRVYNKMSIDRLCADIQPHRMWKPPPRRMQSSFAARQGRRNPFDRR